MIADLWAVDHRDGCHREKQRIFKGNTCTCSGAYTSVLTPGFEWVSRHLEMCPKTIDNLGGAGTFFCTCPHFTRQFAAIHEHEGVGLVRNGALHRFEGVKGYAIEMIRSDPNEAPWREAWAALLRVTQVSESGIPYRDELPDGPVLLYKSEEECPNPDLGILPRCHFCGSFPICVYHIRNCC